MEPYPAITAEMEQHGRALLAERYRSVPLDAYRDVEVVMVEERPEAWIFGERLPETLLLVPVAFRPRYVGESQRDRITRQVIMVSRLVGWDCLNPRRETEEV